MKRVFAWLGKRKNYLLWTVILLAIVAGVKVYIDTNTFKVHTVHLETEKLPAGSELTMLQISDLHNKVFDEGNKGLTETAVTLDPDIIVLTGDLVDRKTKDFRDVFAFVEKLTSFHGHVYFVTGNHEWDHPRVEELLNGLKERDVAVLNNRNVLLEHHHETIRLVGVDNVSTHHENMREAFVNIRPDEYTILLSHAPTVVDKYDHLPADLILSGHTHGGQVRLPLIGAVIAPDEGFFPTWDKGIYEFSDHQYLYIDSGLGTSIAPIRFLNQSQVSFIAITGTGPMQN